MKKLINEKSLDFYSGIIRGNLQLAEKIVFDKIFDFFYCNPNKEHFITFEENGKPKIFTMFCLSDIPLMDGAFFRILYNLPEFTVKSPYDKPFKLLKIIDEDDLVTIVLDNCFIEVLKSIKKEDYTYLKSNIYTILNSILLSDFITIINKLFDGLINKENLEKDNFDKFLNDLHIEKSNYSKITVIDILLLCTMLNLIEVKKSEEKFEINIKELLKHEKTD